MKRFFLVVFISIALVSCRTQNQAAANLYGTIYYPSPKGDVWWLPADCLLVGSNCPQPRASLIENSLWPMEWSNDGGKSLIYKKTSSEDGFAVFDSQSYAWSPLVDMAYLDSAKFSPDGKYVAVVGVKEGEGAQATDVQDKLASVYLFSVDSSTLKDFTPQLRGRKFNVNWLNNHTVLFETHVPYGECGLFAVDIETNVQTRLTRRPACDVRAAPSPDGTQIAYVEQDSNNVDLHRLYRMKSDGSDRQLVVELPTVSMLPYWTVDGDSLIIQALTRRDGQWLSTVYTIGLDGTGLREVYTDKRLLAVRILPKSVKDHILVFMRNDRLGNVDEYRLVNLSDGSSIGLMVPGFDSGKAPEWISWQP